MVNFGPWRLRLVRLFGAPQQISTGSASWLRYCSDVAQRKPTKLCTMLGRLLGWYTIYTFSGGSCRIREFRQVQNSLRVQVLRSPTLPAFLHGSRVVGVRQTLRSSAEGATYIRQGGHHVGHWPHSSSIFLLSFFPRLISAVADSMSTILPHMVWP